MKIGGSTEGIVNFYYNNKDILQGDSKISTDKDLLLKQNDGGMSQALSNFKEIAEHFPDISFIVTDDYNGVKEEYKGISNVSCFGYPGKISIALNEEVVKNWHEDSENITTMINTLKSQYEAINSNAMRPDSVHPEGYKYTYVTVGYSYKGSGSLTYYSSGYTKDISPYLYSGSSKDTGINNIKNQYLQNIILKSQDEMADRLFKTGTKDKKSIKPFKTDKWLEKYYKQLIYQ